MSEAGASQVVFETPSAAGPVERISYEGPGEMPAALNLLSTHSSSETRARLAEQAGSARAPGP
jgi:hypothetical protein